MVVGASRLVGLGGNTFRTDRRQHLETMRKNKRQADQNVHKQPDSLVPLVKWVIVSQGVFQLEKLAKCFLTSPDGASPREIEKS